MKLLILRPASICCTFKSGHASSRAPNVNKMGCPFYFHRSRVRLKRKYLFRSRKKEIIILHSTNAHVRCTIQQNGSQSESTIEISGCVTVFEDFNNFVDMNGSIYIYSGVAYVTKICSRGHFLLIRVCIYQNVRLCK